MNLVNANSVVKIDGASSLVTLLDHLGRSNLNDDLVGRSVV